MTSTRHTELGQAANDVERGSAARPAIVLDAHELQIDFATRRGRVRALDSATLTVRQGEVVALVGESGSGKSTLGMAAGRLLAANAVHVGGRLALGGVSILDCDAPTVRSLRRTMLGYVFQNPVAALDPTMRVQKQMELAAPAAANDWPVARALEDVGLRDVARVLRSYPHQLSGGMAQRVAIAMALRRRPKLLIADEPTASVDATLRAQILQLLVQRCREQHCMICTRSPRMPPKSPSCTAAASSSMARPLTFWPSPPIPTREPSSRQCRARNGPESGWRRSGVSPSCSTVRAPAARSPIAAHRRCANA